MNESEAMSQSSKNRKNKSRTDWSTGFYFSLFGLTRVN